MKRWGGVFAPTFRKHRDGCGNIENHVDVIGYELIEADPEEGVALYLVQVGFKDTTEVVYDYEVEVEIDTDFDKELALKDVIRQIEHR